MPASDYWNQPNYPPPLEDVAMQLEHDHSSDAIRKRLGAGPKAGYVRDWVYGGIDGSITTFAIVAGAAGASLSARIVLILGFANLLADGLSMAAGNYSATKTELDDVERLRAVERKHIAAEPEGEREEIRQIFAAKGFGGDDLERIVEVISANEEAWTDTMLVEEYGISPALRSPLKAAASTFAAFVGCGFLPLLPFVMQVPGAFAISIMLTGATFFAIGTAKSRWSVARWWRSGTEVLVIGMSAALIAYVVGAGLEAIL